MPGSLMFLPAAHSVSPVAVLLSLETKPMSPAPMAGVSVCLLPRMKKSLPTFSFCPEVELKTWESAFMVPETTLK